MRLVRSNPLGSATLDDLFVLKYEWLMRWALHFAQGDRSTAEDLVQDTFVRFAITHPELDDPENAEALLYTYLKHVHLAHLRRLQKYPFQDLSIDEFDSISVGLRQNPSANPIDVQNDLRRILTYLCWRKGSAKAASILILRFFYGYFPEEITRIGLVSRPVVDNGLRAARKDLKRHLSDSDKARVLRLDGGPKFVPSAEALPTEQFIDEVREILLSWRCGACLPAEQLAGRYLTEPAKPIECELLAHIVSCQRCLDVITHSQKIPPLAERSFDGALVERHNPKSMSREITFAKNGGLKRSLSIVRSRIQEVLEHQPSSLTLVVNGHVVATQDVSSAVCKQDVEINIGVPIELIEVLSEQGLCLLAMPVFSVPPNAPPEIHRQVRLSCGRTVEAWLRFTSMGPRVETSYRDPALQNAVEESAEFDGSDAAHSEQHETSSFVTKSNVEPPRRAPLWSKLWAKLKRVALPDMNPIFATALILAAASLLCFAVWWNQLPHITTNALLMRAEAWDPAAHPSRAPGVIYQRISIKTPQRIVNRAIYRDAQGIRRPKRQELDAADAQLKERLAKAGVNWDEPLSATSYRDWHDRQRGWQDAIEKTGAHLLKLTTTVSDGPIMQESLTVRDTDFHPVARTIELQDTGTVEIAELSYEVLPWSAAREDWFEPLAPSPLGAAVSSPGVHVLPRMPRFPSEAELDEAELGTRMVLHQLSADTNERIEIDRGANGVQVKGIVATAERKHEIEARLHQVPHVLSALYTFQELQDRQSAANEITSIRQASLAATPSPLEAHLTGQGMSRAEAGELEIDLSNASVTVSRESKAIEDLLVQFGPNKRLTPAAREAFDQLLADHRAKILSSLKEEEQLLAQAGIPLAPLNGDESSRQLIPAMERHRALCSELLSSNDSHPRNAQAIAVELEQSLRRLRAIVTNLSNPFAAPAMSFSPLPTNQNN